MREKFKIVERGHLPTRQQYNTLSKVAQRFANMGTGGRNGIHGDSFVSFDSLFQGAMFIFEITEIIDGIEESDDSSAESSTIQGDSKQYKGRIIWYSHQDEEWDSLDGAEKTIQKEWLLDEGGTSDENSYAVGDTVIAYWDEQRGMFIPISGGTSNILLVKLSAALDWDDYTGVSGVVWAGTPEVATARTLTEIVPIKGITTSGTFASGSFVLVQKKDGRWKVVGAPCS